MTSGTNDIADSLRHLIAEGGITEIALQKMTGIPQERLRSFLDEAGPGRTLTAEPPALSLDEGTRLSLLAAQLTEGMQIRDDERLKAVLESLTIECGLTSAHIARLTGLDANDIEHILRNPTRVPIERKYEVSIRSSYLINAVNQARAR